MTPGKDATAKDEKKEDKKEEKKSSFMSRMFGGDKKDKDKKGNTKDEQKI